MSVVIITLQRCWKQSLVLWLTVYVRKKPLNKSISCTSSVTDTKRRAIRHHTLTNGRNDCHAQKMHQVTLCQLPIWHEYFNRCGQIPEPNVYVNVSWMCFTETWTGDSLFSFKHNNNNNRQLPRFEMFYWCIVIISYSQDSLLLNSTRQARRPKQEACWAL